MAFSLKGYESSIKTSRVATESLVGEGNEIIKKASWDLGVDSALLKPCKEHFHHPHAVQMFEHIMYHHTMKHETVLFTNCTAKKPYSTSRTYKTIIGGTFPYEHTYDLVTLSSIGVIPSQFEKYYPFSHYAWDDNHNTPKDVRAEFMLVNSERIRRFQEKFPYKNIIAVFRVSSKGKEALLIGTKLLGRDVIEVPSKIAFEGMKDNCVKMNTFQLTNNDTLGELNQVLKDLYDGKTVSGRQSPTPAEVKAIVSARMKLQRGRRQELKAKGHTGEEIDEIMYGKKKGVKKSGNSKQLSFPI